MSELYEYNPRQISEEELLMLNSINKISEPIVNLYNKKVSKSEKIKVTYNEAGKAVYKL